MIPPGLAIAVAGGTAEPVERVVASLFSVGICGGGLGGFVGIFGSGFSFFDVFGQGFVWRVEREPVGDRQIEEAGRQTAFESEAQRLPFRRELGEGIEGGLARVLGIVDEQRDRRRQLRIAQPFQQRLSLGRPLHQDAIGVQGLQRLEQTARAAWTMVADAEEMEGRIGHVAPPLWARRAQSWSRQAR